MSVRLNFKVTHLSCVSVEFYFSKNWHSVGMKHTNVKLTKLAAVSLIRKFPNNTLETAY
jgi:hypothetical protein